MDSPEDYPNLRPQSMIFPVQVQTMPVAPPCIRNLQVHPMMTWFEAKVSAELAKMGAFALLRAIAPARPDFWDPLRLEAYK